MTKYNIDDFKAKYINMAINWLVIIDVIRNDANHTEFVCKCRCGNIVHRLPKVLLGKNPPISCGCYRSSKEKGEQKRQYYEDHPELKVRLSNKRKQFYKDNPDAIKSIADHNRQLYESEPERRSQVGNRISDWFKNNPDKVSEWSDHRRQYYKDHPEIGENRSKLYKENPDILNKISDGNKNYNRQHPEKVIRLNELNSKSALEKRQSSNYTKLLEVIHPEDISLVVTGKAKAGTIIRTRCPHCGIYASHKVNDVYTLSREDFKRGTAPLCRECHIKLTSCLTSDYENEIAERVTTFYYGECIKNDRLILNGKELDLYYPEKKIAIEFNGDYWHNEEHKLKDYHYNKFKACLEKGILLVSIFEFEWNTRKDEITHYLKDLFSSIENKISFTNEGHMNNNYPSFKYLYHLGDLIEDCYTTKCGKVYTCGYSKLNT